ncbi:MAG: helicase HerA-like domain-containing protein [Candidatus Diapherotrites archaeon]
MAEETAEKEEEERPFGAEERVKVLKNSSEKDLFEEMLGEEKKAKPKEAKVEITQNKEAGFIAIKEHKKPRKKRAEKSVLKDAEKIDEKSMEEGGQEEPVTGGETRFPRGSEEESGGDEWGEHHDALAELAVENGTREIGTKEKDWDLYEKPEREKIRQTLIEKAKKAGEEDSSSGGGAIALKFLDDVEKNSVFIGRKKSVHKKFGYEGALMVGKVNEDDYKESKVHLDSLNPHVIFVCGARGSGKCLTGGTLITLESGEVIPIKELEERNEKLFALNHELKIGATNRTEFFKRTVNRTLSLRLKSGKEIELTPEHPLFTINGWLPAEELGKGDRIATPRVLPAFGSRKMKECDVKLLAYLLAEGHLSNHFVLFSNMDEKIISDFMLGVREFDEGLKIEGHGALGCFRVAQKKKKVDTSHIVRNEQGQFTDKGFIVAQKSSLMQWLESIGIYGKLSAEKFIPKEVMELEKAQLALFLNRLFSCDGTIHRVSRTTNWSISIGFSSEKMTRQVQHLLLRFGILSRFRKKQSKLKGKIFKSFETVLYAENVIKYLNEIGFYGEKEERAAIALPEMNAKKRNPNFDTVPKDVWERFPSGNWKTIGRELGYAPQSFHNTKLYAPSREKLLKIATIAQNKGAQMLAEADIYWDTIEEIKENLEEKEVFDISVPEFHNFVANDIIVHNSYILGVIAEEIAKHNPNIGAVVIDPVGVFWSMKFPNKEEKELQILSEWGLQANGLDNLKVFIPEGMKSETPKNTYDGTFSIPPSLLTPDDWCLTYGIERFSPTGLLLDKVIKKVGHGHKTLDGKYVKGKDKAFGLNDLINCLEFDAELNSREKGYKQDSIRALTTRFEAAKTWGIFSDRGTPLAELSREGQLTVIDTSFLEDNVTALVIGILARRILAARKITTRKEAASQFKSEGGMKEILELEIPPTWLFIDEAHTLMPSGNQKTAATDSLVEYVKQGRRPGCSLVAATQQPSAIDTKVLSQLDILIAHKLIFDDDIKAVFKRAPTIVPSRYKKGNFIKTLPVGTALVADRSEETSRAFIMKIRPRMSQHEGREAEATDRDITLKPEQVEKFASEAILRQLESDGTVEIREIDRVVATMSAKYKAKAQLSKVLDLLEKKGAIVEKDIVRLPGVQAEKEEEEKEEMKREAGEEAPAEKEAPQKVAEAVEILAFQNRLGEKEAKTAVDRFRKKKVLGFLGSEEEVKALRLKHATVWKVYFEEFGPKNEFYPRECYINSLDGEMLHFDGKKFVESKGFSLFYDLGEEQLKVARELRGNVKYSLPQIVEKTGVEESKVKRSLDNLISLKLAGTGKDQKSGKNYYFLKAEMDLPPRSDHEMVSSPKKVPLVRSEAVEKERENISREKLPEVLRRLWPNALVKKVSEIHRPFWEATLAEKGKERKIWVDAVSGERIK